MKENYLKEVHELLLQRYGLGLGTFLLLFFAFFVSLFLYTSGLDVPIHDWAIRVFPQGFWQNLWGYISHAGEAWVQAVICIVIAVIYYYRCNYRMSRVFYTAIPIFLFVGLLIRIPKFVLGRPRPKMFENLDIMYDFEWFEMASRMHSFPSGHTTTSFCLLAVIMPFYGHKVQMLLFATAATIGFSRVGLGSHYMGDVVAGAVIGYALGAYIKTKLKLERVRNI